MAELIAPLSPMLMSCPREAAVTRVIPMDRITSSEAPKRIFGYVPVKCPVDHGNPEVVSTLDQINDNEDHQNREGKEEMG